MRKMIIILFFSLTATNSFCKINIDSLLSIWEDNNLHDTVRLNALYDIAWDGYMFSDADSAFYFATNYYDFAKKKGLKKDMADAMNLQGVSFYVRGDYDKALGYYKKSFELRKNIDDKKGIASSLNNIGLVYWYQGDFENASLNYKKSVKIAHEIGDKLGEANSLNNIGLIKSDQGDYAGAIDYYRKSLKVREETDDEQGVAAGLNNIGLIYFSQKDYDKAINYFNKSITLAKEIGDKQAIARPHSNIGNIYLYKKDYEKAIIHYSISLKIGEEIGNKQGISSSLNNIGIIYKNKGDFDEAIKYFTKSLNIAQEIGDKRGMSSTYMNIGDMHKKQGDFKTAIVYCEKALFEAKKVGAINEIKSSSQILYESYKSIGEKQKALKMFELFTETRDSINSKENQKEIIRQEYKYSYEKQKAIDDKEHEKQLLISEEQEEKQKVISYSIAFGLGLVVLFSIFIFNRLQITRKQKVLIENQKLEVEQQKEIVEEKNQEITDSIAYAKRIQNAILPPAKVVKEYLKESFILYKPKDVVAGDFYWMESVAPTGNKKETNILFAAADCTGHGVPGAMVSVVCNNALNRSVREYGLTEPGKILDKTREIVIQEFEKSDEEVKDGMDIALCSLEGKKLQYAGAHNPLWIIRNGGIIEMKADKQPIGKFDNQQPYTAHSIDLQKGDTIYIFSDGYVDQFGGEKGKKFKTSAFRELLLSIQDKSMEDQKLIIDKTFETWKGNLDQIDDVCLIGVRI
jgi:tetratricopeptide (TPR) repeat protein